MFGKRSTADNRPAPSPPPAPAAAPQQQAPQAAPKPAASPGVIEGGRAPIPSTGLGAQLVPAPPVTAISPGVVLPRVNVTAPVTVVPVLPPTMRRELTDPATTVVLELARAM